MKNRSMKTLLFSAALQAFPAVLGAQPALTTVSVPTFAWVQGSKAVYLDYPNGKAAIIEIDLDSKAKRTLAPDAGVNPWHVEYGYDGTNLAYVLFAIKPQYPLEHINVATGAKKTLDGDTEWKESVWMGGRFAVWVDYRHKTTADKNGEIYMHDIAAGTNKRLTNNPGYQAKPVTDGKHVAWLDYSGGNKAVLTLYDIATGQTLVPSATDSHQDNPRVDGDWLVWEDYRNAKTDTTNADIYAYNIKSKEVKALCNKPGFQGRPFLHSTAVVWEDYRTGGDASKVDVWGYDLAKQAEHQITTRVGYDASPVVNGGRVVWFGTEGSVMNLYVGSLPFATPISLARPADFPTRENRIRWYRLDGRNLHRVPGRVLEADAGKATAHEYLKWR